MALPESKNTTAKYQAFISYQRKDEKWAKWLQDKLEYFKLPSIDSSEEQYLRPVFRDVTDLKPGSLSKQIIEALDSSNYLIAICSPNYSCSKWCDAEIARFIETGRVNRIIPFIIDGTPYDEKNECFPPSLKSLRGTSDELLGSDIRPISADYAFVQVVATMLNLNVDFLWKRYLRAEEAEKQRIKEQNEKLLCMQARISSGKARSMIDSWPFDNDKARKIAVELLPHDVAYPSRPWTPEAEAILRDTGKTILSCQELPDRGAIICYSRTRIACEGLRGPVDLKNPATFDLSVRVYDQDSKLQYTICPAKYAETMAFTLDERFLVLRDSESVYLFNAEDGTEMCSYQIKGVNEITNVFRNHVICSSRKDIVVLDISAGTRITLKGHIGKILSLDADEDRGVLLSTSADQTARLWDISSGECMKETALNFTVECVSLDEDSDNATCICTCSGSGVCKNLDYIKFSQSDSVHSMPLIGCQWRVFSMKCFPEAGYIVVENTGGTFVFDMNSGQCVMSLEDRHLFQAGDNLDTITVVNNGILLETYAFPTRQQLIIQAVAEMKDYSLSDEDKYAFFLE